MVGKSVQSKSLKRIIYWLIVLIAVGAGLLLANKSQAITWNGYWSWTKDSPVVTYTKAIPDATAMTLCASDLMMMPVAGESELQAVCLNDSDRLRFGMYYKDGAYRPVVGLTYDNKMHKLVDSPCTIYDRCLYVPRADILITKRQARPIIGEAIVIYKDFSKHITRILDPISLATTYDFDLSYKPDYLYTNDPAKTWAVGGYAASDNGEWLALELRDKGIYVVNTRNYEMRRISSMQFNYFGGMMPTTEMAISNDGHHVAIMGMNAGLSVFDVDSSCGDLATGEDIFNATPLKASCPQAYIDTGKFIPRFYAAYHPRFSDNGAQLSFYAKGYAGDQREVVLRVAEYHPPRLDYLALGDSYSSGEGETSDNYYVKGTNDEYEKCHLSTRSYPYLTAKLLGIADIDVKSVACSGATTKDIIGLDADYWGQGNRLGAQQAGYDIERKTLAQTTAREDFVPGRIHQSVFVETYQPAILTIGIGGNDVGFMDKLKACLSVGTCEWAATPEGREKTALEIQGLFYTLLGTYRELHRLSPQTTIYAVGYPKIIDPVAGCSGLTGTMFDSAERKFMDEGIKYINQVIAAAAKKSGVKYIDVENALGNQLLCGTESPRAMNGVRLGDDSSIFSNSKMTKIIGYESFHPTPNGHELISNVVARLISQNKAIVGCDPNQAVCVDSVLPPWPSNYWLIDGLTHDYARQHVVKFASDTEGAANMRQKTIKTPQLMFEPNSQVKVELHSSVVELGSFMADSNGSIDVNIELPSDTPDGYHSIHLYGTSGSGDQVDLYDIIAVTSEPEIDQVVDEVIDVIPVINDAAPSPPASPTISDVQPALTQVTLESSDVANNPTNIDNGVDRAVGDARRKNGDLATVSSAEAAVMGDSIEAVTPNVRINHNDTINPVYYVVAGVVVAAIMTALYYWRRKVRRG